MDIVKQTQFIQKDITQFYSNQNYENVPKILQNIIHEKFNLILDIVKISNQQNIQNVFSLLYDIHHMIQNDVRQKIILEKYPEFPYPRMFQIILNRIETHKLEKYLNISYQIRNLQNKQNILQKISFIKKKCKIEVQNKNSKFVKKYPRLYNMIFDGIDMNILTQIVENIKQVESDKIDDKTYAKNVALILAKKYYPKEVLKDEGLL